MSHPDDGTIQMLLDGELDSAERVRIEAHIGGCAACSARLAEAREFQAEADRLVEVLAVPAAPAVTRAARGRPRLLRSLAWAASVTLAVALGYWSRGTGVQAPGALPEGSRPTQVGVNSPPSAPSVPTEPPIAAPGAPAAKAQPAPVLAQRNTRDDAAGAPAADALASTERAAAAPEAKSLAEAEAKERVADRPAANIVAPSPVPGAAWRVIAMEEGVQMLGGQIRLIDGLTPDRVETGPGTAVAGADPALPVVRVVYGAGAVALDEQRPTPAAAARRESGGYAAKASGAVTEWQERGGIRYVVTGSVSADSLRALGARVR